MTRLLKILLVTISTFILLSVISAILLIVFVNPNKFKPKISQYVQTKTGREIQIAGDIEWSFFPYLGLKVNDIKLGNPANFPSQPFAQVKEVNVRLALLPLLKKQIQADQLYLKGLQLNLIKNKAGAVNWEIALAQTATTPATTVSAEQAAAAPLIMNIAKIQITDAGANYWDQQSNAKYSVKQLQFDSKNVSFNNFFPIRLKFNAESKQPSMTSEVSLQGNLYINPEQYQYQFKTAKLDVNLAGSNLPNGKLHLTASTDINMDKQALMVKPLKIVLDKQTEIRGEITKNLSTQLISFNLAAPELHLPASSAIDTKAPPASNATGIQQSTASTALLPLALLKNLAANGSLQIDKLIANKLVVSNIKLNLNANNGLIQLAPIQAKLYQGTYQGQISVDARTNTPSLVTQQTLKNIQLGPLLSAIGSESKFPLSGKGNVSLQLTTLGNDIATWTNNLNGRVGFAVNDGVISNIDLEYQLARIRNFINKQSQPKQETPNQTTFSNLTGNFQVNRGVAHNTDLLLQAKTAVVKGQGDIDLRNKTLAYRIQAAATSENLGGDAYKIQDYLGGSLPILINGKWESPRVEPDWNTISQAIAKALIKQQTSRLKDKLSQQINKNLGDETGKQLKNALDKLFG